MGIASPPDTLDPGATGLALTLLISMAMFDPLVWWLPTGDGGSKFVPGLAESYTVSPDASVYTFKLRKGVTFHDGTKFDATAVKATYDHIVDPATKSKSGLGALGPYKETKILDPYTVQIIFTEPNAGFLHQQAAGNFGIASPAALEKYGPTGFGNHPVGTGPFKFVSYAAGSQLTLVKNPAYTWGPTALSAKPPLLDKLRLPDRDRRQRPVQRAPVGPAADRHEPAAQRHRGRAEVGPVQAAHGAVHRHPARHADQRHQAADRRPAGPAGDHVRGRPGDAGQAGPVRRRHARAHRAHADHPRVQQVLGRACTATTRPRRMPCSTRRAGRWAPAGSAPRTARSSRSRSSCSPTAAWRLPTEFVVSELNKVGLHRVHHGSAVRHRAGVLQLRRAQPRGVRLLRHRPLPAQHLGRTPTPSSPGSTGRTTTTRRWTR